MNQKTAVLRIRPVNSSSMVDAVTFRPFEWERILRRSWRHLPFSITRRGVGAGIGLFQYAVLRLMAPYFFNISLCPRSSPISRRWRWLRPEAAKFHTPHTALVFQFDAGAPFSRSSFPRKWLQKTIQTQASKTQPRSNQSRSFNTSSLLKSETHKHCVSTYESGKCEQITSQIGQLFCSRAPLESRRVPFAAGAKGARSPGHECLYCLKGGSQNHPRNYATSQIFHPQIFHIDNEFKTVQHRSPHPGSQAAIGPKSHCHISNQRGRA
jgi:hypothetical protein